MPDPITTPTTSPTSTDSAPGVIVAGPFTGSLDSDPTVQAAIAANPKSALATTELYVVIFFNIIASMKAAGLLPGGGAVAQYVAFISAAVMNTIYILARTQLKAAHVDAAAQVAAAAAKPASSSLAIQNVTPAPAAAPPVSA